MGYQKVLIVGSGGREHALCWAASRSAATIFVAPGNGGTVGNLGAATIVPVTCTSIPDIVAFVLKERPELVIVGPEAPLVEGLTDALNSVGVPCFGPTKAAAELEGSKAFSKDFMVRHGIPTARHASFSSFREAEAHIRAAPYPVVVKASGLCAGKGVVIPRDVQAAVDAARSMLVDRAFGVAGSLIVVEERLSGVEASVLAFADGKTVVPLPAAQDHKRVFEFDRGGNTGGMGAYAPAPIVTPSMLEAITARVLQPTIDGMAREGKPYVGVLYAGIMITPDGTPHALEFNCRLGDPETQVVLPLLETDFLDVALACCKGQLGGMQVRVKKGVAAATVVVASEGYPGSYPKGVPISIAAPLSSSVLSPSARSGSMVFHAGTVQGEAGQGLLTAGGRVLSVTSLGPSITAAVKASYAAIDECVSFKGMQVRRDIGGVYVRPHAEAAPLRIAVMGSTRGSSFVPVLAAITSGELLGVEVAVVISNKPDAGILDKARAAGLPAVCVESKGKTREAFDSEALAVLAAHSVDLVVLVGFMRILSPLFVDKYAWRILNVHPSLLPDFSGLMDVEVHAAVVQAGRAVSGATVHFVDVDVDAGPALVQTRVDVSAEDTAESLKAKVQATEGPALISAIRLFTPDGPLDLLTALRKAGGEWSKVSSMFAGCIVPRAVATRTRSTHTGKLTYAAAGVDIDAGDALVERIKPLAKSTARPGADADLGGFGGLFDLVAAGYKDPLLVSGTDGVGTKLRIAQVAGVHNTVGIDLVAMSVNDILVQGAEPLIFLDYFACGHLEVGVAADVISGIAEGCRQSACALVGGETAEMPSMYHDGDYDLAGFAVGAVERDRVLPRMADIVPGDVLLALASSGVHSNGFSLARRIVSEYGVDMQGPPPFPSKAARLCDALLTPTKIYVRALLPSLKAPSGCKIKAMAHITGGGLPDNIPRVLPPGQQAVIDMTSWPMPPVFTWMQSVGTGVEPSEMARTFNCGLGMVLVVAPEHVDTVKAAIEAEGETVHVVGRMDTLPSADAPQVRLDKIAEAFTGKYSA